MEMLEAERLILRRWQIDDVECRLDEVNDRIDQTESRLDEISDISRSVIK